MSGYARGLIRYRMITSATDVDMLLGRQLRIDCLDMGKNRKMYKPEARGDSEHYACNVLDTQSLGQPHC